MADETIDHERYENRMGKVLHMGPNVFQYFKDGEYKNLPGERPFDVGSIVRVPRHVVHRFQYFAIGEKLITERDDKTGQMVTEKLTVRVPIDCVVVQDTDVVSVVIDPARELKFW